MATLKDCLGGFSVVKSFKAETAIRNLFEKSDRSLERAKCEKRKWGVIIGALGGVAGVAAQFGTFLVGGWMALSGRGVTPGILVIFLDLTANVINPIRELPELLAARRAALGLIDKLAVALEVQTQDAGAPIPNRLDRGIELRNVSFGYETDHEILHHVSVKFEAGKRYAIVGASGSGKSTLLNLLMAGRGGYTGEFFYDGQELRGISTESLYELVSMVQQQAFLFDASIRDNLTMFREFPESEVQRVVGCPV